MQKMIIKNEHLLKRNIFQQERETATLSDSFTFHFQEFSPNLHAFRAKDYIHELACELTLEVKETIVSLEDEGEEGAYLAPIVACSFPTINLQGFNEKLIFDTYLQRLIMVQFQIKILEQLLLFCEQKDAINLTLTIQDDNLDYLEVYSRFFVFEGQANTEKREQTEIMIPTDMNVYDKVIDFMDKIDREFRCALWRGQSSNSAFREYIKRYSLVVI